MPFKPKHLAISISFLVASSFFATFAQDASPICANPVETVCSDSSFRKQEREGAAQIRKEITKDAKKNSESRIADMKKRIPAIKVFKRLNARAKIRNEEILKSARRILGELESVSTSEADIAKIKNYIYESIDQGSFADHIKVLFKENISNVVVGNFGDFLDRMEQEDNADAKYLDNLCGDDGLTANAFAFQLKEQGKYKRYVLICPGFIVNLKLIKSQKERFNSVLQVMVHELTHHIDTGNFTKPVYGKYLDCIAKFRSDKLTIGAEASKVCSKSGKSSQECKDENTYAHSREMVADEWANRVLAIHARAENMSIKETTKMTSDSWVRLCGSMDQGKHPSGNFRITVATQNPDMADILNCDNKNKKKVTCTFEGELTL